MAKLTGISEIRELLGDDDFLKVVEAFGGRRLYIPRSKGHLYSPHANGLDPAINAKLVDFAAGVAIRVPLARDFCAGCYRARGMSHAAIASKLGMTETGVDKLFKRRAGKPGGKTP